MYSEERTKELRKISGEVVYADALTSFLYELIRDHLTPGTVEKLVVGAVNEPSERLFINGWLAHYAHNLAEKLTKEKNIEEPQQKPNIKETEDADYILSNMVSLGQLDVKEAEEIRKEMAEFEKDNGKG